MYGLKSSEVEKQREKYGSNKLPEKKLKTWFQFFMETFKDHINQILLAMMIVFTVIAVFGQGSYSEPIGVAVVLLAIALLGMNTGLKSQKSTKELKDRTSVHYCNVIRNGKSSISIQMIWLSVIWLSFSPEKPFMQMVIW